MEAARWDEDPSFPEVPPTLFGGSSRIDGNILLHVARGNASSVRLASLVFCRGIKFVVRWIPSEFNLPMVAAEKQRVNVDESFGNREEGGAG